MPIDVDIAHCDLTELANQIRDQRYGDLTVIIELAREYRQNADEGEREFMRLLRAIELSGLWRELDVSGVYGVFLKTHHICDSIRYQTGVVTFDLIPTETIDKISFAAAKVIAKIPEPARREEAIKKAVQWACDNQRPPSVQTTQGLAGIRPVPSKSAVKRQETLDENTLLRAEIQRLTNLLIHHGIDPKEQIERAAE